jgi:hypothetical protein
LQELGESFEKVAESPAATFQTPFKPSWYRLGKVMAVGSKFL